MQSSARSKAKVETGVQLVERWCLAPLRNHTFFSLAELNRELALKLAALNDRPFQKMDGNRRLLLETLERPALKPLPAEAFEYCDWKKARVNIDYHVQIDGHLYSVPYSLVRKEVDVRLTARTVEILHLGKRVAAHPRNHTRGCFTTDPEHRPKSHRAHLEWTPTRLINWGHSIGPAVNWSEISSRVDHTPSRVTAAVWGCSVWSDAMTSRDWRPPAPGL